MAPLVTNAKVDYQTNKKVRYSSQFKEQGILLKPTDFKVWTSKLDKLKQVVRVANPSELSIHQSQFTMTKRRANTVKGREAEFSAIESQAVNLESIDQDAYLQETANEDDGIQGLNSSDEQVDEGGENLP